MDLTRQFSVFECTEFLKSYFWDSDFSIFSDIKVSKLAVLIK